MTKLIVPELLSVAEIAFLPFNQFALNSDTSPRAFALGAIKMRDEHAAKHRQAAVIAVEALEKLGDTETLEKIKKIYEQKEK